MNGAWMRDPLRAGMEARVRGTQRLALGAALTLAFFALALKLCAAMEGAAVIALVGAGCAALLLAGAWRALREEPVIVLLCAALLAMLAVAAHLAMLDIKPGRMSKVLAPMLEGMWNYDLGTAMAWEDGAWSGGYLIVMALISRLEAFPQMYAVKLFDMACQTAAALAVLKLALTRGAKPGAAVGAMLACVLAPTMLLSAGCWAQCDAMFAALALWGLALLLKDHPVWGCILWGLAAATKLQAGFLFPLLLVFFMKGRVSIRHLLAGLAAFVLAQAAVSWGMELMTGAFRVAQGMVTTIMDSSGLTAMSATTLPDELVSVIEDVGFIDSIPLWAVTLLGSLFIWVLSLVMILTVYSRFFKLYIATAIAPIPLASFAGQPSSSIGIAFLKSYAAICLEGCVIVLACVIFSAFASSPPAIADDTLAAATIVWNYVGELIFNMLVLVGAIKMSDRIIRELMGLG